MSMAMRETDKSGPSGPCPEPRPDEVGARVKAIAEPIAAALGLSVRSVQYRGTRAGGTLKITIDKPGGVTLEDCTRISRSVSHALDVEDAIDNRYTLEVSSPGLDRPLQSLQEFEQAVGRLVRVKTRPTWDGPRVVVGRVASVDAAVVRLVPAEEVEQAIPWEAITQARLEVEW